MAQRGGQRGPPETENQRRRGGDARQRHAHASRTGRDTVKEKRGGGDPERRPRGPGGGEGFREKGGRGQGGERGRWWPRPRARAPRSGPATPVASAEPWLMVRLPGGGGRRRATNEAPESPAPVMDGPRGRAEGRERAGGPTKINVSFSRSLAGMRLCKAWAAGWGSRGTDRKTEPRRLRRGCRRAERPRGKGGHKGRETGCQRLREMELGSGGVGERDGDRETEREGEKSSGERSRDRGRDT